MEISNDSNNSNSSTSSDPNPKPKTWLEFWPFAKKFDPAYFVKVPDSDRSDSNNRYEHRSPIFVYVVSFSKHVDDTVLPASTTAVPEQLDTKSVFDVLSKSDTFKSTKIIKPLKLATNLSKSFVKLKSTLLLSNHFSLLSVGSN